MYNYKPFPGGVPLRSRAIETLIHDPHSCIRSFITFDRLFD